MSAVEADKIERAADRIAAPGAWTQSRYAREDDGTPCLIDSPDAVCWCALGAMAIEGVRGPGLQESTLWLEYNDTPGRTQAEVVARLRALAAQVRARS